MASHNSRRQKRKDWLQRISPYRKYAKYRDDVLKMFESFASFWDEHIGRTSTVEKLIDMNTTRIGMRSLILYLGLRKNIKVKPLQIDNMLVMNIAELIEMKAVSIQFFAPKNGKILC